MSEASIQASNALDSASQNQQSLLIDRCLAGEDGAFVAVYNMYAGRIYRLCFSILHHREDAEEVLQDTFEYAFRKLHRFDERKASFTTWLYHIAVCRCRNKRRRKRLLTVPLSEFFTSELADSSETTPGEALVLDERQQIIWNALSRLSPKLKETAVLRYYEGFTYQQIGQILSISPKTAESRMRLAHQALRKSLALVFEVTNVGED